MKKIFYSICIFIFIFILIYFKFFSFHTQIHKVSDFELKLPFYSKIYHNWYIFSPYWYTNWYTDWYTNFQHKNKHIDVARYAYYFNLYPGSRMLLFESEE